MIVWVPAIDVSSWMDVVVAPSNRVVSPRLRSAVGPVMVAPKSLYVAPISSVPGLSPWIEMIGGPLVAFPAARAWSLALEPERRRLLMLRELRPADRRLHTLP